MKSKSGALDQEARPIEQKYCGIHRDVLQSPLGRKHR